MKLRYKPTVAGRFTQARWLLERRPPAALNLRRAQTVRSSDRQPRSSIGIGLRYLPCLFLLHRSKPLTNSANCAPVLAEPLTLLVIWHAVSETCEN